MPIQATIILLFVAVLALIGLGTWLVRRFASNRLGANSNRGRQPRLAVIDAAAVDGRRRLVLVRRDNIEHLLMIGGPTDVVIEPNIVRAATPQRDQAPGRAPAGTELPQRIAPLPDAGHWADAAVDAPDFQEQMPHELAPRANRSSFSDEGRRQSSTTAERRTVDPLASLTPEPRPDLRAEPPSVRPRPIPRGSESPMPRASAHEATGRAPSIRPTERAGAPTAVSTADQNLAEMAQRLESALRRPGGDPAANRAPPVAPEPPSRAASVGTPAQHNAAPPVAPPDPRGSFENLEDEMASLLGRPKTPT